MKFDVVTFGSAVVDTFVSTDVAEKKGFMEYKVGEKLLIRDLKFDIGGAGTNTAVAFSRLGLKTGCITKLGEDNNGKDILKNLEDEGVEYLGRTVKHKLSGYSIVLDSKGGDRTILTYKGVNNEIEIKDIKNFKTKWLYLSSLMGKSFETQKKVATILKKRGTKIAFNPSSYLIKTENLDRLLKICDIVVLNKEEARMLVGNREKDLLKGMGKLTDAIAVITDKDKLISCSQGHRRYVLMPNKNVKVVERTGAGDAFASGFVAGQIAGRTVPESLILGLMESEAVITNFGAKNNLIKMRLRR